MATTFAQGYALLIAVNESAYPDAALPDVIKDVAALRSVLIDPERCSYAAGNVKAITGKDSTREGIMAGLDWLRDKISSDTSSNATAVIYYTGHGHVEEQSYYLIPYDVNLNRIKTSSIRAEDFAEDIAALKPRRLLVMLDCCHASGMDVKDLEPAGARLRDAALPVQLFMKGEKGLSPGENSKGMDVLSQGAGRAVISSSQASESSWVRKDRAMSIFTYHVIEALTGHAQPQEGATEVLVSDVMSHVWRRVPASAKADCNAVQRPDFQVSGNFPIALLLGGKGLDKGEVPPDPLDRAATLDPAETSYEANLIGNGAIAQGPGATAVGANGVYVGGKNSGNINTNIQTNIDTGGAAYVGGNVNAGRDFVGRDRTTHGEETSLGNVADSTGISIGTGAQSTVTQGVTGPELEKLFAPLIAAIAQQAPAHVQVTAAQQVQELKQEVAKGKQADDSKIAKILDGLFEMVPGAVGAVVSMFATPILGGIVGPVTKFVLDKLKAR